MYYQIKDQDIKDKKFKFVDGFFALADSYFNEKDIAKVQELLGSDYNGFQIKSAEIVYKRDSDPGPKKHAAHVLVGVKQVAKDENGEVIEPEENPNRVGEYIVLSCPPFVDPVGNKEIHL